MRAPGHQRHTPCRHCGRPIRNAALAAHERACALHPGDEALREGRAEGLSIEHLARRFGVGRWVMSHWLSDLGLCSRQAHINFTVDRPPLKLVPALAPQRGRKGTCNESCPGWSICQARQQYGIWPLCCAPEETEVSLVRKRLRSEPSW